MDKCKLRFARAAEAGVAPVAKVKDGSMWQAIEAQKRELDSLRPLTARSLAALEAWYDVELTYTSNAIEGNTLTRQETAIILDKGITIGGKPLRDHLEAVDHFDAVRFVRAFAAGKAPIEEDAVRQLHGIVLARSQPAEAGRYSQIQRRIAGSGVVFPSPNKIPREMEALGVSLARQPSTPRSAFEAHYRLVSIHPFSDGNGRTARLLMNLILFRGGYPPVVIGLDRRQTYLETLEKAQLGGSKEPYELFMADRLLTSLSDYLGHLRKELEDGPVGPPR